MEVGVSGDGDEALRPYQLTVQVEMWLWRSCGAYFDTVAVTPQFHAFGLTRQ